MKITVIGAGAIGSAVAQDLLADAAVAQVQVCDARARSLQALSAQIKQDKRCRSFQVDARDLPGLEPILKGSDCVISCAPPQYNLSLAELCLSKGIHYCDLGGSDDVLEQQLALNKQARDKSIWIVPNCGLDPGLANVLCLYGIAQFDSVEAVHLRVGDVPLHPEPPFNFRISWSAEKLLEDYTAPVHVIEEGKFIDKEPLSDEEDIHFTGPFDEMEAFYSGSSLLPLASDLLDKVNTFDHKLIRWPGHAAQMRFLLALGLGEDRYIDVRTHLTYRDVLLRRMRQHLGGTYPDVVLLRVLIQGLKDGKESTLVYEMINRFDEEHNVSAMKRCTSIPTVVTALLIASERIPGGGAAPPEAVVSHQTFYDMVTARGLNITATWHNGYVDVRNPEG